MSDLGDLMRSWRDRLAPEAAALSVPGRRRAPGLRREELALRAGVSLDYVTRLEQGRASAPSAPVLTSLARALRLSEDERDHLFRLAGQPVPSPGSGREHLTPGVRRLLERLEGVPVAVYDASWTLLSHNRCWAALMGDPVDGTARGRNVLWTCFVGPPSRVQHTPEQRAAFETALVADLRLTTGRHPHDEQMPVLIAALQAASARFAQLWAAGVVGEHHEDQKRIEHPLVGSLILDCDVLTVSGSDLRIVAYTAAPGSPDAEALALLGGLRTSPPT